MKKQLKIKEWGYEVGYDLLGIILKDYKSKNWDKSIEAHQDLIVDILKNKTIGAVEIVNWSLHSHLPRELGKNVEDIQVELDDSEEHPKISIKMKIKKDNKIKNFVMRGEIEYEDILRELE